MISEEPLVVIIVSTTGEGEPPDTVSRFWRKLKRKNVPMDLLNGVHYALLGMYEPSHKGHRIFDICILLRDYYCD